MDNCEISLQAGELFDYSKVWNNTDASEIAFLSPGLALPLLSATGILLWSLYLIILLAGSKELRKKECTEMEDNQKNRLGTYLNSMSPVANEWCRATKDARWLLPKLFRYV